MIFNFLNVLFENVYVLHESTRATSGTPVYFLLMYQPVLFVLWGRCGCYLKHNSIFSPLLVNSSLGTMSQLIVNEPTLPAACIPIP